MTDFLAKCKGVAYSDMDTATKSRWPWIDVVQDCGAVGDGTTDDSMAFQTAIDLGITNGKPVMVPPGTYAVSGLTSDSPFTIFSIAGPRLTTLAGRSTDTLLSLTGGADYSNISGLNFSNANYLGTGLLIYNARECHIDNCYFQGWSIGVHIQALDQGTWYNNFVGCKWDVNDIGVEFSQAVGGTLKPNRNRFIGCTFVVQRTYHVYAYAGDTNAFIKCDFGHAPKMIYNNVNNLSFTSCCFEGDATQTADYMENTATGTDYSFIDCSFANGVYTSWNTAVDGIRIRRNAGWYINKRDIYLESDDSTDTFFYAQQSGDAAARFAMAMSGRMYWGDGTAAHDTTLYRSAADTLYTPDSFTVRAFLGWGVPSLVTIAADGVLTVTSSYHQVEGEGNAADDLVTINGGSSGDLLILRSYDNDHDITIKHGTGNIYLPGAVDFVLTNTRDTVIFIRTSTTWLALATSDNA